MQTVILLTLCLMALTIPVQVTAEVETAPCTLPGGGTLPEGKEIKVDACTTCTCSNPGLPALCDTIYCDIPRCPLGMRVGYKAGQCCPICEPAPTGSTV